MNRLPHHVGRTRRAGGIVPWLIFGLMLLGGLVATVLVARVLLRQQATRGWSAVPCTILESGVAEDFGRDDRPYAVRVRYAYAVGGREYVGDAYRRGYGGNNDYAAAQRVADRLAAGSSSTSYVNPADPAQAVLAHASYAWLLFLLIPLAFVAVGAAGVWRIGRYGKPITLPTGHQPVSPRTLIVILTLVLAFCAAFLPLFLYPAYQVIASESWRQAPCTVENARVRVVSESSGGGSRRGSRRRSPTYAVEVLYAYEFEGRRYKSSRLRFLTGSSSGLEAKQERVNQLLNPPGPVYCYVNPADPYEAVLERVFTWEFILAAIPLFFILLAGTGLFFTVRYARRQRRRRDEQGSGTARGVARIGRRGK